MKTTSVSKHKAYLYTHFDKHRYTFPNRRKTNISCGTNQPETRLTCESLKSEAH